jgi:protein subunit release factor B
VKRSVRRDKRQWVDEPAQKAEEAEKKEREDLKELQITTRKLSRKGFHRNKPVRNKRGEIISTQEEHSRDGRDISWRC